MVFETNRQIRKFIENSKIIKTRTISKRDGTWNQLCSALDTIADTYQAIEKFLQSSNKWFLTNPYLITYGLLQALFIQQDAVSFLKVSLIGGNEIDWKTTHPKVNEIRQIRNETVGHPVQKKRKGKNSQYINNEISSCTIHRTSISKEGFGYVLYLHEKPEYKSVTFKEIIESQEKILQCELLELLKKLQDEEDVQKKV